MLKGDLLVVSITDVTLFIGNGGSLNTDKTSSDYGKVTVPGANDPDAIGFSISGEPDAGHLHCHPGIERDGGIHALTPVRKYTGLQASLGAAQLHGIDGFVLMGRDLSSKPTQRPSRLRARNR